jgi:hypothetical protein
LISNISNAELHFFAIANKRRVFIMPTQGRPRTRNQLYRMYDPKLSNKFRPNASRDASLFFFLFKYFIETEKKMTLSLIKRNTRKETHELMIHKKITKLGMHAGLMKRGMYTICEF